ncbi:MAG: cadherin-like beta sandwich domain-containing protein [Oscillospiraceae bacterium]|nr:cadherin-like beta sandwich domain-containing protein [Oscillospiraceae bacterium]
MKINKKLISVITAFSLCASMLCTPVAWADDDIEPTPEASPGATEAPGEEPGGGSDSTSGRKLYVDFMGRGETPTDVSPGNASLNSQDERDQTEFWVGVAVDKVHDLDLFTKGVYSVELAFEYDSSYIEPYSLAKSTTWKEALIGGNLKSGTNNDVWWNESLYEVISVTETDIDDVNDREDLTNGKNRAADPHWKMCTVCITMKDTGEDAPDMTKARFNGLASEEKQYLAKLPFKVKKVPAESDIDQNPTVLCLVRGPETLNIGAGSWGVDPYSAWEATVTDPNDQTNMKTLFTFNGDISLFGNSSSELDINDIIPVKPMSGEETEDTEYTLSTNKITMSKDGFKPGAYEYYLSVPYETETLKLKIAASTAPSVMKVNDTSLTIKSTDGGYQVTDVFMLNTVDTSIDTDGFNNTVLIGDGSTTYRIHIRRLFKPKIELKAGNSPFGMIQRMVEKDEWTEEYAEKAQEYFITGKDENGNNNADYEQMFHNPDYTPDDVPDKELAVNNKTIYSLAAWGNTENKDIDFDNPDVNPDRDPTAIFIYQYSSFKEPGFTAKDSMGNDITSVTCKISVYRFTENDLSEDMTEDNKDDITMNNVAEGYMYTRITSENSNFIRPDIYEMEYSFYDSIADETVSAYRKVIVLFPFGDSDLNNIVNANDQVKILNYASKGSAAPFYDSSITPESAGNLYLYRIVDTDMNSIMNANDQVKILNYASKGSAAPIAPFYIDLK